MSSFLNLPLNTYLVWGVAVAAIVYGFGLGRKANAMRAGPALKRWGLWSGTAATVLCGAGILIVSRTVAADNVGIGRSDVFEVGTYLWAKENFIAVNRSGSFLIPYPNERIFLLVEYKVKDPVKLKALYEELVSHRAGLGKEHFLSSCGLDEPWKHGADPLASWLQFKTRERLPTNPTSGDSYIQYSLEPVTTVLIECGLTARMSLVRKDLLRSV